VYYISQAVAETRRQYLRAGAKAGRLLAAFAGEVKAGV